MRWPKEGPSIPVLSLERSQLHNDSPSLLTTTEKLKELGLNELADDVKKIALSAMVKGIYFPF